MITCSSCGQENPDAARFCFACGRPLEAAVGAPREERRFVTIIFADLVGFTARSERLDPEDVQAILTRYHRCLRKEIESFGGIVEKFIGDAVVGIFGAPTAYGDDAERAVRAALAVRDSVDELNASEPELQIRVAVNTGEAVVALGARVDLGEAMVAGDVVNTASRLQQAAPTNGVLVGAETYRATRDAIVYEPAERVVARGKSLPLDVWVALEARTPIGDRGVSSAPLVGRTRELELLRRMWERSAAERRPHLVTVLGPAGVGKTRLATEFAEVVRKSGARTFQGRSLPYRESSAYFAFTLHVKQLCRIFESDPLDVAQRKLGETVGRLVAPPDAEIVAQHLGILLGLDPEASSADREALFSSVHSLIEAVARDRPTMLVFEDIHWADESLLDLIEFLGARLRDVPILLLTLARPDLLDDRPTWGGGLPAYTALPLEPLNADEGRDLAEHLLAGDGDRAEAIAATAEGNPLFIEQLAATVAERPEQGSAVLPTTIRALLAARLDALPRPERSLLLDAAVGGRTFWRGALERMVEETEGLSELLAALETRDLIRRDRVSVIEGDQQFSFKHVLIRDVAYELLPRARRRDRHAQVASYLEEATSEVGEAAAALARHWRDAGESERAVTYFMAAAEEAERGWAKEHAAALYREALELVPEDDVGRRRELRRRLAIARQALFHVLDARLLGKRD